MNEPKLKYQIHFRAYIGADAKFLATPRTGPMFPYVPEGISIADAISLIEYSRMHSSDIGYPHDFWLVPVWDF